MANFKHSGCLGDIIYSLAAVRELSPSKYDKANLWIVPNVPKRLPPWAGQAGQEVLVSPDQIEALTPLLAGQSYMNLCGAMDPAIKISYDLDAFRTTGFDLARGDIGRYYAYALGVNPRLDRAWLRVDPSQEFADTILVNRTQRYRGDVNYRFLADRKIVFVGTIAEYASFRQECPRVPHVIAKDYLQLAQWIAGCKLFVGNQSFCFSLAEAMKTKRLLEVFKPCPNVIVHGPNGFDFISQFWFEELVNRATAD